MQCAQFVGLTYGKLGTTPQREAPFEGADIEGFSHLRTLGGTWGHPGDEDVARSYTRPLVAIRSSRSILSANSVQDLAMDK